MSSDDAPEAIRSPQPEPPKQGWWRRNRNAIIAGTLALVAGVALGAASQSEENDKAKKDAKKEAASIITGAQADRDRAVEELEDAKSEQEQLKSEQKELAGEIKEARTKVADERAKLKTLAADVGKAEREAAKNSFGGDGTFVVGDDINPGTYRADASAGCYWARLSSLDTSDILDNKGLFINKSAG